MTIHELYGELAASLVRACWPQGAVLPRAGAHLGGSGGVSAFQGAYYILGLLGVATVDDKLAVDVDQVSQFVIARSRADQITLPPIDEVLEAWISLAHQLGNASVKRKPFTPHEDIRLVMDVLAGFGYAEALGNTFLWTDRIGHAMQMSGWWDENGLSYEESLERDVDLEMRAALASIPEDVRLEALGDNPTAVAKALAARWVGGAWLPDSVDDTSWWRWSSLAAEAKRLVELVQDTNGSPTPDIN